VITELFHGIRWLDAQLHRKIGPAYNAILGLGLTFEIVRHIREASEHQSTGMIRSILAIVLFGFLLLHQIAELAEHVDRRFRSDRETRR
jgi:hypothetical protein